jgi:hypothetical protein
MSRSFNTAARGGPRVAWPHDRTGRHIDNGRISLAAITAWLLFVLGIGHVAYALARFREPLLSGLAAGGAGQFSAPEVRRTAFWFLMFGPMLMLAGQVAIHAAGIGDLYLLRLVGANLLAVSMAGLLAMPKSPFMAGALVSALIVAASYGIL